MMRKLAIAFVVTISMGLPAYAGLWESNRFSCHNGNIASTKKLPVLENAGFNGELWT